jgi:Ankyrin repeats (3 copies)
VLDEFPQTLAETYERSLRDIREENWKNAHSLFQFVAVASRPLRVEELADLLAFDFEARPVPTFRPDWRPEDPVDFLLSTCSSLLSVVEVEDDFRVIEFSHFSVKDFLTSDYLSASRDNVSRRYHIRMEPAHAMVARACLGALLHLDGKPGSDSLQEFPLVDYASRHWMDHAQFEIVSTSVQEGLELLFDPTKPHFSIWMSIYDPDEPLHSEIPSGSPLHYAALYGFCPLTEFLVVKRSQDVNARRLSDNYTPLFMASHNGYSEVTKLLLRLGADTNARSKSGDTPLHLASGGGHPEVAQDPLRHGADATTPGVNDFTPASHKGYVKVVQLLLDPASDVNDLANNNQTTLHQSTHPYVYRVVLNLGTEAHPATAVTTLDHFTGPNEDILRLQRFFSTTAQMGTRTTRMT